jgi:pyruvate/2-oxoglutarate dehydrogenase complex dihydrolipoamide dehydrogenase (E3) component
LTDGEALGFVNVITAANSDEILGVTIVGHHASEQIAEFVFAMTHRMGLKSLSKVNHIYPTVSESNRLLASSWRRQHIHKNIRTILAYFLKIRRR